MRAHPASLRLVLTCIILLIASVAGQTTIAGAQSGGICLSSAEASLLDQINTYRQVNGLAPLVASPTLTSAARHHAESMAAFDYFPSDYSVQHEGPNHDQTITWQQNIAAAGYPDNTHTTRSAIIGAGVSSASAIARSLSGLPAYDRVLRDSRFHAIGIGFGSNPASNEGTYWALTFGSVSDGTVMACPGVALSVPIVGSGRTNNSGSSALAYDNDFGTSWSTTGRNPRAAYVWFDLGGVTDISGIEWMFAEPGAADQFAIDVSLDRSAWTQVAMKSNGAVNQWRSVSWRGAARYIRFYFSNPNDDPVLGYLSEVRVLG